MSAQTLDDEQYHHLKLDPALYSLVEPDEVEFIKGLTHIQDDEELKQHIIAVQKEAFKVSLIKFIMSFT